MTEIYQLRRTGRVSTSQNSTDIMKLDVGVARFGRSLSNDFYIDSEVLKCFISRRHAEIRGVTQKSGETKFVLTDFGLNGTYVNDTRVQGQQTLKDGDKVIFGHKNGMNIKPGEFAAQPDSEFQFVFEVVSSPTSTSESPTQTNKKSTNKNSPPNKTENILSSTNINNVNNGHKKSRDQPPPDDDEDDDDDEDAPDGGAEVQNSNSSDEEESDSSSKADSSSAESDADETAATKPTQSRAGRGSTGSVPTAPLSSARLYNNGKNKPQQKKRGLTDSGVHSGTSDSNEDDIKKDEGDGDRDTTMKYSSTSPKRGKPPIKKKTPPVPMLPPASKKPKVKITESIAEKAAKKAEERAEILREAREAKEAREEPVWYQKASCASLDCKKPRGKKIGWVQCDDCDGWYHTVCVGCDYKAVQSDDAEFRCGCT